MLHDIENMYYNYAECLSSHERKGLCQCLTHQYMCFVTFDNVYTARQPKVGAYVFYILT